jgi:hypothetical protein
MPKAKPASASEDKIRARAHEIWEHAGRPDGHHLTHWRQAVAELSARTGKPRAAAAKSAKPAAAAKPAKAAAKPAKAKAKPAAKGKPAAKPAAQNRRGAAAR